MSVVVVIDPGHGGDNLGGNTDEFIEKELTMKVARYMKERLEQYEGVDVYLTHENTTDKDLSRKERIQIAEDLNADFLFSLHFNMSEYHTLFGSEVWVSAFDEYYKQGKDFALIEMEGLTEELGFFDRGIKTKLNEEGSDYYGILQYGRSLGVPSVIIEHCHMDEDRDAYFLRRDEEEACKTFGTVDADSVAKYFKLKSDVLGVDYTNYKSDVTAMPDHVMGQDITEPEYCSISLSASDESSGLYTIEAKAFDPDSKVQYYSISSDGGQTFGELYPWNDDVKANKACDNDTIHIEYESVGEEDKSVVIRAYNRYELTADSDPITIPGRIIDMENNIEQTEDLENYTEIRVDTDTTDTIQMLKDSWITPVVLCIIIFVVVASVKALISGLKRRRKK